ncbi:MAG: hypothetical protein R3Y19_05160 [Rikenellaceae bacterium]
MKKNKKTDSSWKRISIGGISGILFGAAATFAKASPSLAASPNITPIDPLVDDHSDQEEDYATMNEAVDQDNSYIQEEEVEVQTTQQIPLAVIDQNSSFSEAFAEAREQVGSGGVFQWQGAFYSTYYAEEWEELTPEEQNQISNHYGYALDEQDDQSYTAQSGQNAMDDDVVVEAATSGAGFSGEANEEYYAQEYDTADKNGVDVQILEVSTIDTEDGAMNLAYAEVDGEQIMILDVDNDGVFDLVGGDYNGDGEVSDNEIEDISSEGLLVDDLREMSQGLDIFSGGCCSSEGGCCGNNSYQEPDQQSNYDEEDLSYASAQQLGIDPNLPDYAN